jgi:pSer/pThr/pTyr-binding forkhead associated (FHA) protein
MEFPFSMGEETSVGRKDAITGIYPDIDLTPIDPKRSVARRHAKIYRRGSRFYLSEEIGTMSATYLNDHPLETGVPEEFRNGDVLRFGLVALKVVYSE